MMTTLLPLVLVSGSFLVGCNGDTTTDSDSTSTMDSGTTVLDGCVITK